MAQLPMYAAQVNSPELTLSTAITTTVQSVIVVAGDVTNKLATAPNLFVVGYGEDAETIYFPTAGVESPAGIWTFTGCTRAKDAKGNVGVAKTWAAGTPVTRSYTAYDQDTFKANIEDLALRRSTYDVVVYQDATYTYAVTRAGVQLCAPTANTANANVPIQAAIDSIASTYSGIGYSNSTPPFAPGYGGGKLFIASGEYHPSAKINVKRGVAVVCNDSVNTVFHIPNIDFVEIYPQSSWTGGFVYTNVDYTGTAMLLDGSARLYLWGGQTCFIRDVVFYKHYTTSGGTCIHLKCDSSGTGTTADYGVYGVEISNINMGGFWQYGIRMTIGDHAQGYDNVVWNSIHDIWFRFLEYPIFMSFPGTYGSMGSNIFKNIFIEAYMYSPYTVDGITICGGSNVFQNIYVADWSSVNNGDIINVTSKASNTRLLGLPTPSSLMTVTDNGVGTIIQWYKRGLLPLTPQNAIYPDLNPAGKGQLDSATLFFPVSYGIFKPGTYRELERMCWITFVKSDFDTSKMTAQISWSGETGGEYKNCEWLLYAVRITDATYFDTALPLVATILDGSRGASTLCQAISSESSEFAVTGTGDTILWMLKRSASANDTLVGNARLHGVRIRYTEVS
jgi:hypothetical protein